MITPALCIFLATIQLFPSTLLGLFQRWALSAFVEVLNLTFSDSNYGYSYPVVANVTRYDQPELTHFRWILPSVGLRARF